MKTFRLILASAAFFCGLLQAHAQYVPGSNFVNFFAGNSNFSARVETHLEYKGEKSSSVAKYSRSEGKFRIDLDVAKIKGKPFEPAEIRDASIGLVGMFTQQTLTNKPDPVIGGLLGKVTAIYRPDLKITYLIYPEIKSYVELPANASATNAEPDYQTSITELGREVVDGHACIKNTVTLTDKNGNVDESTVWNATDLNNFTVKMEARKQDFDAIVLFKDVSLKKPDDSQFEPPAGFKKYDVYIDMILEELKKYWRR